MIATSESPSGLFGLSRAKLELAFSNMGLPKFRARQALLWVYQRKELNPEAWTDFPAALRSQLKGAFQSPLALLEESQSEDGVVKFVFETARKQCVESVLIPHEGRNTLCVSSQVGCAMDCAFCATGKQGFLSNLSSGEIVAQLFEVSTRFPEPIGNVVFMGMGEPLLNTEAVISASDLMMDDFGFGLSRRRVTLSTCGLVPQMYTWMQQSNAALAVSLHAPTDALRDTLMPVNQKYPLKELMEACRAYVKLKSEDAKRFVTIEYVMLKGVNDSLGEARLLSKLLNGLRCKINLIPYNAHPKAPFECSTLEAMEAFASQLKRSGYLVTIRRSRGDEVSGACGQLAGRHTDGRHMNGAGN